MAGAARQDDPVFALDIHIVMIPTPAGARVPLRLDMQRLHWFAAVD